MIELSSAVPNITVLCQADNQKMKDSRGSIAGRCCLSAVLIALTAETTFLHFKTWQLENQLASKIDMTIFQDESLPRRITVKQNVPESLIDEIKQVENMIKWRSKREVEDEKRHILKQLSSISQYILHDRNSKCNNATLVCKKGKRGRRGKAGPRGIKGDQGVKGERGDIGPIGMTGPAGPAGSPGKGGQKGEPGLPGRSLEKPQIITKLQKTFNTTENSNFTIFCEAKGNPEPEIFWKFEKQEKDSRYSFRLKGTLDIRNINSGDEGEIRCVAENILGQATTATQLVVHTKPKVSFFKEGVFTIIGQPLEISCNATGKPKPIITWKKFSGQISGVSILSKDGTNLKLRIDKTVPTDAGYYICEAKNYMGLSKSMLHIQINDAADCSALKRRGETSDGVYMIYPDRAIPFKVYCDMTTDGGGWTVIQRRMDGSVDFYRDWESYKSGFGDLAGEFWIGNEKIHRLTKRKNTMIRFDLEDVDGSKAFAKYDSFYIDGEANQFQLHASSYSGTAGDSFLYHSGRKFSTKDKDHDASSRNCAKMHYGGWWYNQCHYSNLNGQYLNGPHNSRWKGVIWYSFKGDRNSLKKTELKIKTKY